jgi:hypothetical protein
MKNKVLALIFIILTSGCSSFKLDTQTAVFSDLPLPHRAYSIRNISGNKYILNETKKIKNLQLGKVVTVVLIEEYKMGTKKLIEGRDAWFKASSIVIDCNNKNKDQSIAVEWDAYYEDRLLNKLIKQINYGLNETNFISLARAPISDKTGYISEDSLLDLCKGLH